MDLGLPRSLASYSLLSSSQKLLDEIGGGAMAFSLRKLRDDVSSNVIRLRRSTDNVEVYVDFDSNDEISTNSPITNVSGEPVAPLTLGTGWTKITGSSGTQTLSPAGSLNIGGTYGTPYKVKISMGETVASGSTVSFAGSIAAVTGSNWRLYPAKSDNSIATSGSPLGLTSTGSFNGSFLLDADAVSFVIENTSGTENFQLQYGVSGTKSVGDTAATTLGAFISEASNPDLHVVTWYDQSGNGNNFSNLTRSTQPKIVDSGTYLGHIDFGADTEKLAISSISNIPSGDQSYHIVQAEGAVASSTFNITFWNLSFSHYMYYQNTALVSGFVVGTGTGAANTRGEFNQFSVTGRFSPNEQLTTKNTLAYSDGGGVSSDPHALTSALLGDGPSASVNAKFKIKELVFLNTADSDIVSTVSSNQTTYFGTPD